MEKFFIIGDFDFERYERLKDSAYFQYVRSNLKTLEKRIIYPLFVQFDYVPIVLRGYQDVDRNSFGESYRASYLHSLGAAIDFKLKDRETTYKAFNYVRDNLTFDRMVLNKASGVIHVQINVFSTRLSFTSVIRNQPDNRFAD